ncbi:U4/U6.U5 tri-snRNP-associated protein 2-like, partial [Trifolium pratense]
MTSKREMVTGDRVEEEGVDLELKRQRVDENSSPSSPPVSIANPLSGLANYYADIDEEEDYYQRDKSTVSDNRNGGSQQNGHKYEGD